MMLQNPITALIVMIRTMTYASNVHAVMNAQKNAEKMCNLNIGIKL